MVKFSFALVADHYAATKAKLNFTIVNDGSTDDTNKLGAIGDINYVLKTQNVDDDIMVVAGDNLFSKKLEGFGQFCREKNAPVLALYDAAKTVQEWTDKGVLCGQMDVDKVRLVTHFQQSDDDVQYVLERICKA